MDKEKKCLNSPGSAAAVNAGQDGFNSYQMHSKSSNSHPFSHEM